MVTMESTTAEQRLRRAYRRREQARLAWETVSSSDDSAEATAWQALRVERARVEACLADWMDEWERAELRGEVSHG